MTVNLSAPSAGVPQRAAAFGTCGSAGGSSLHAFNHDQQVLGEPHPPSASLISIFTPPLPVSKRWLVKVKRLTPPEPQEARLHRLDAPEAITDGALTFQHQILVHLRLAPTATPPGCGDDTKVRVEF